MPCTQQSGNVIVCKSSTETKMTANNTMVCLHWV